MFKKVDVNELGFNPFDEINNHWTLISAVNNGKVNTMTASWGNQGILWGKPVTTIYVRQSRYTKEFIDGQDYYTVCLFDGYKKELGYLGKVSGRDEDKIKTVNFDIEMIEGQPAFKQAKCVLICKKIYVDDIDVDKIPDEYVKRYYENGDHHTMYIGEIVGCYVK